MEKEVHEDEEFEIPWLTLILKMWKDKCKQAKV